MFICVGENQGERMAVGSGETVEIAVKNWASDNEAYYQEFSTWKPDIYETKGAAINVSIEYNFVVTQ